ncbi:GFA family protein [Myxococcus sp. K15C18031901]|uniref:GFA family protein n=1 Tax=Myxococcus dinghuensis TaxID=2906761 RepID=UPI0020A71BD2|nr:GFA family protein [Myxococcus dinghuensis]MCP3104061.1 GFA family protein [Myxococcus dinghuensis]
MSETQKSYEGGCHCGRVRYEVKLDLSQPVITCNCSICQKSGGMLTFVPTELFTLRSGQDALTDYQFNKKVIHHLFCSSCGVRSFARGTTPDGKAMIAINARCLDGVDAAALKTMPVDGRSF